MEVQKPVMLQVSVNTENIREILMFLYDEITRQAKEIGYINRSVENLNKMIEVKALSQKIDDYIENTNKRVEALNAHVDSMSKSFVAHQESVRIQLTETRQSNGRAIIANTEKVENLVSPLMELPNQMSALQAKFDAALSDDATSTRLQKQNEMENTLKEMQNKINQMDSSYQANQKAMSQRMQRAEVKLANATSRAGSSSVNRSAGVNEEGSAGTRTRGGIPLGNTSPERRSSLMPRATKIGNNDSDEEDFQFEKRSSSSAGTRRSSDTFNTRDLTSKRSSKQRHSLPLRGSTGFYSSQQSLGSKGRGQDGADEYDEYDEQLRDGGSSGRNRPGRGRSAESVNKIIAELVAQKEQEIQERANAQIANMYQEMSAKIEEMERQMNDTSTILGAARKGFRERGGELTPLAIPDGGDCLDENTAIGAFPCRCLACGRPKSMATTPTPTVDNHLWSVLNCPPLGNGQRDLTQTCSSVKVMRTQPVSSTATARGEALPTKRLASGSKRNIRSAQASRPITSRL